MKKELSFYRGCSGSYESRAPNYAKIVGEGKHQQVHARPYPPPASALIALSRCCDSWSGCT